MRISSIAALCAAPLALAGTVDMDMQIRGALAARNGLNVGSEGPQSNNQKDYNSGQNGNSNNGQNGDKNNGQNGNNSGQNNNNAVIEQTETTEIIILWVNPGDGAATTTINSAAASTVAATAATTTVVVGGTEKVYTPDTINANIGDVVIFEFHQENHTATQSAFTSPCVKLAGGMDTGFMANLNGSASPPPQVAMTVNVTTPLWFYCRQTGHCGLGMTFSINPTANKTQADFQALAIQQNGTTATGAPPATSSAVAAPPSTSSSASGLTTGSGTLNTDGSCSCAVVCAQGSIPNPAAQGLNSFGGMASFIPASAMEVTAVTQTFQKRRA